MRGRAGLCLVLVTLSAACARVEATTRTERGPLLRTFERPVVLEGGVTAEVRVEWPRLALALTAHDVCRVQAVEEYAEERVTERSSGAAGPALSTGLANVLASAVLFATSFVASPAPDTSVIDQGGRYGPSTRQYLQGASAVTLGIGGPALAVGVIAMLRSGEDVELRRSEQVVGERDARCHARPVSGPVELVGAAGGAVSRPAAEGLVEVAATELDAAPEALRFAGREVALTVEGQQALEAFGACLTLARAAPATLEQLDEGALLVRAQLLRSCREARGAALADEVRAVDEALARRRPGGAAEGPAGGPAPASFEAALAAHAPLLRLGPGGEGHALWEAPAAHEGTAVHLVGVLVTGGAGAEAVAQVGARRVVLRLPSPRAWGAELAAGTRVEAVAVVAGTATAQGRVVPALRAVWVRAAF